MGEEIREAIQSLSQESPLRLFLDDELAFYKTYCNQFTSCVIREKKILEFENPNRMRVVYEFDVKKLKKTVTPLFIFLPNTRKNWMRVNWEGRRLYISSCEAVRDVIFNVVKDDLAALKSTIKYADTPNTLWNEVIWPYEEHIPCFVDGTFIKKQEESGQMMIEFYDSFKDFSHVGQRCSLFEERGYLYDYYLDAGNSHWIYVKAPDRFQVMMFTSDNWAKVIPGNDPEIKAYRIFPKPEDNKVRFRIDIRVPRTLKWWYGMIVILGFVYILAFLIISIFLTCKSTKLTPAFAQVGISLVAAIIASRGWMMNDETVLKKVSLIMTWLAIAILVCLSVMYSISAFLVGM
jgi:hypothetical protein